MQTQFSLLYLTAGADLPLGDTLLWTVLPALLFVSTLLLCAGIRQLLPLWGLAIVTAGLHAGLAAGIVHEVGLPWLSLVRILILTGQILLSLLALDCSRADLETDPFAVLERLIAPATAYLALASALETLSAAALARRLLY